MILSHFIRCFALHLGGDLFDIAATEFLASLLNIVVIISSK